MAGAVEGLLPSTSGDSFEQFKSQMHSEGFCEKDAVKFMNLARNGLKHSDVEGFDFSLVNEINALLMLGRALERFQNNFTDWDETQEIKIFAEELDYVFSRDKGPVDVSRINGFADNLANSISRST